MKKLSNYIKFSYGFADLCFIFMVTFSNTYYLVFFTEVLKISPVQAGVIMTFGRILDTISVPILGPIIEKSNFKWGRYRSWILIGSFFILLFNTIMCANLTGLPEGVYIVLYTIFYAAFCIATNVSYIGYTSLNSTLTVDAAERVQLSTFRGQGNSIGKILAGWCLLPLIYLVAGAQEMTVQGFFITALLLGLMTVLGYGNLFAATKDYKDSGVAVKGGKAEKVTVAQMFKQVVTNRPLLAILVADVCRVLTTLLIVAMFPYFYIYVVKNPDIIPTFFGLTSILMLIGSTLVPFITKKLTKKQTYILGMVWICAALVLMFFNASNATLVLIIACIGYVGVAFPNVVNTAMYADITDYSEWKTGYNARAVIFSVYQLSIKIAAVFSTSVAAFGLGLIGLQSGAEPTPEVIEGIKSLAMFFPAGVSLVAVIAMLFYNVNERKLPELRAEIAERKVADN